MSKELAGKRRKSTRYLVEYPTLPSFRIQPELIEVRQVQGNHDVAILTYPSNRGNFHTQLRTGVPVKVTWTQGPRKKTWVGYVSVTSDLKAGQTERPTKVYCIGASFLMKNSSPRVFKDKTIPEVASQIAKEFGLKFIGDSHPVRWEQLTITTESYWEWLQEHARQIGFACYIDGVDLVFRSVDKLLKTNNSNLPIFQYWNMPLPASKVALDRTLDSIEMLSGEYLEDSWGETRTTKQVGGVDPITGIPFIVQKSPATVGKSLRKDLNGVLFSNHDSARVANSKDWASYAATGIAHLARFTLPAKIIGQGDPRVHAWGMIYVDGTGERTDGAWLVRSVVHTLNRGGEYSVQITAATDGLGASSVDFVGNNFNSSQYQDRSIIGKINVEQYLADSAFTSSPTSDSSIVKLPFGTRTTDTSAVLKNVTNIDDLIRSNTTPAKPGITRTPHLWRSRTPGNSLDLRRQ